MSPYFTSNGRAYLLHTLNHHDLGCAVPRWYVCQWDIIANQPKRRARCRADVLYVLSSHRMVEDLLAKRSYVPNWSESQEEDLVKGAAEVFMFMRLQVIWI